MDDEAWSELLQFIMRTISYAHVSVIDGDEEKLKVMKVTTVGDKKGNHHQSLLHAPNVMTYKQADMGSHFEYVWTVSYLGSIPSPTVQYLQPPRKPYVIYPNYSNNSLSLQHQMMRDNTSTNQYTWNETQLSIPCPVFQYNAVWTPTVQDVQYLPYRAKTGRLLHTSLLSALDSDHSSSIDTYRTTWKPPTDNTGSLMSNSSSSIVSNKVPTYASTPKKGKHEPPTPERRCNFCKEMGYSVFFHTSHDQAVGGKVICPILRTLRCEVCGATGDNAHIRCNKKSQRPKHSQKRA